MPAAKAAGIFVLIQSLESDWTDATMLSRPARLEGNQLMTNEEMQKAMDFIVEQQAQSSAKIDALAEAQTRNTEGIGALLSIAEIHEREINTLSHQVSSLSKNIATLGETTRATDGRLNALINVVERQI